LREKPPLIYGSCVTARYDVRYDAIALQDSACASLEDGRRASCRSLVATAARNAAPSTTRTAATQLTIVFKRTRDRCVVTRRFVRDGFSRRAVPATAAVHDSDIAIATY